MTHPARTVAAIDCGTNSIKILIGSFGDGPPEVLLRDSRVVRLGQGVDRTGMLADEALARTFAALDELAEMIRRHGVPPEPVLVVDIGGGSTELVLGEDGDRQAVSMDIGSVRLHERHLHSDPPTAAEVAACVADIDEHLDACGVPLERTRSAIGTSGTIKTLACGVLVLGAYDREAFDRAVLSNAETAAFVGDLVAMSVDARRALPYMHPGRADVIGAGALIWSGILSRVPVPDHLVSEADIVHGIAAAI